MGAVWLPIVELEEIIGKIAAEKLLAKFAGLDLHIRKKSPHPELIALIGQDAALALTRSRGGTDVRFPVGGKRIPAKVRVLEMLELGHDHQEIAIAVGCGRPYIEQLQRQSRKTNANH